MNECDCEFQHEKAILKVTYVALKMILIFQSNHLQNVSSNKLNKGGFLCSK